MIGNYFGQKAQYLTVQHDIRMLQQITRDPNSITADAFIGIPSAQSSLALQSALQDLSKREAALRAARESYTDEHRIVQDLRLSVQTLRTQTLPQVLTQLISELQARGTDLNRQMASASPSCRTFRRARSSGCACSAMSCRARRSTQCCSSATPRRSSPRRARFPT